MLDIPAQAPAAPPIDDPRLQRARGRARVAFRSEAGRTRLVELYQEGCCKIRLPRPEPGQPAEAVLLNTSGGVTGGDRLDYEVAVGTGAELVATTQAAERIYRSPGGPGYIVNRLSVAEGARLDWLPQETILFDRSGLDRRLEVDLADDASALLCELIVFGRGAMGESVRSLRLADRWRVRRSGRLVYADGIALDGDAETVLARGATGGGAHAFASLVLAERDAETRLETVRLAAADCSSEIGASAWHGLLNVRFLAPAGQALRQDVAAVVERLRERRMPRVWHC